MIICDTNIWYRLGDGRIDPESVLEHELAVTGVNLEELCSSDVIYSNPIAFKRTCQAINKYAKHWLLENPLDSILIELVPYYSPSRHQYVQMQETLDLVLKTDLEVLVKDRAKVCRLKENITEYNKTKNRFITRMNLILPEIRRKVKENYGKRTFRKKDHNIEIFNMLKDILENRTGRKIMSIISWDLFELLVYGWAVYFKEKSLDQSKFKPNDYEDLMNLGYVRPGMKYWTKDEKEPYRTLKKNENAKDYFFNK